MPLSPHLNMEMTAPAWRGSCRGETGAHTRQAVSMSSTQLFLLSLGPLSHSLPSHPLPPPLSSGRRTADQSRTQQGLNHPTRPQAASPPGCLHSAPLRVSASCLAAGQPCHRQLTLPRDWSAMPLVVTPLACHTAGLPCPTAEC